MERESQIVGFIMKLEKGNLKFEVSGLVTKGIIGGFYFSIHNQYMLFIYLFIAFLLHVSGEKKYILGLEIQE